MTEVISPKKVSKRRKRSACFHIPYLIWLHQAMQSQVIVKAVQGHTFADNITLKSS